MKKAILYVSALLIGSSAAFAQDADRSTGQKIKKGAKNTGQAIGKGAKKAGNKTAEYTVKGAAKAMDKTYEGKTAPNGEKVYITSDSRYYWVDKKGGRHFVKEDQLKDKMK
ncbi:MAG: hypothetical protein H0X70_06625 [Segetibacter sp.]|jgi:hypothetical protein|nr:hypothetical protein [Segetibacter sp.]